DDVELVIRADNGVGIDDVFEKVVETVVRRAREIRSERAAVAVELVARRAEALEDFLAAQRIEKAKRQLGERLAQARHRGPGIGGGLRGAAPAAVEVLVNPGIVETAQLPRVQRGEV